MEKIRIEQPSVGGIPHLAVLFFLLVGWLVTSVIAWLAILLPAPIPRRSIRSDPA